ncbi:18043_t:CDS:2, partial [Entrophospora sp. SA101]
TTTLDDPVPITPKLQTYITHNVTLAQPHLRLSINLISGSLDDDSDCDAVEDCRVTKYFIGTGSSNVVVSFGDKVEDTD